MAIASTKSDRWCGVNEPAASLQHGDSFLAETRSAIALSFDLLGQLNNEDYRDLEDRAEIPWRSSGGYNDGKNLAGCSSTS